MKIVNYIEYAIDNVAAALHSTYMYKNGNLNVVIIQ